MPSQKAQPDCVSANVALPARRPLALANSNVKRASKTGVEPGTKRGWYKNPKPANSNALVRTSTTAQPVQKLERPRLPPSARPSIAKGKVIAARRARSFPGSLPFDILRPLCRQLDPFNDQKTLRAISMTCWEGYKAASPRIHHVKSLGNTPVLYRKADFGLSETLSPGSDNPLYRQELERWRQWLHRMLRAWADVRVHTLRSGGTFRKDFAQFLSTVQDIFGSRELFSLVINGNMKIALPSLHILRLDSTFWKDLSSHRIRRTFYDHFPTVREGNITDLCVSMDAEARGRFQPDIASLVATAIDDPAKLGRRPNLLRETWPHAIKVVNHHPTQLKDVMRGIVHGKLNRVFVPDGPAFRPGWEVEMFGVVVKQMEIGTGISARSSWEIIGLADRARPTAQRCDKQKENDRITRLVVKALKNRAVVLAKMPAAQRSARVQRTVERFSGAGENDLLKMTIRADAEPCPGCGRV